MLCSKTRIQIKSLTVGCIEKKNYEKGSQADYKCLHYKGNRVLFECVSCDCYCNSKFFSSAINSVWKLSSV